MFLKIADGFEISIEDIICIININSKTNEDEINKEFILNNKKIIRLCDKNIRSAVVAKINDNIKIYLSSYSVSSIEKSYRKKFL